MKDRMADKNFYHGWLSVLHSKGFAVDVFEMQSVQQRRVKGGNSIKDGTTDVMTRDDRNDRLAPPFTKLDNLFKKLDRCYQ